MPFMLRHKMRPPVGGVVRPKKDIVPNLRKGEPIPPPPAPSLYVVAWLTVPIDKTNQAAAQFEIDNSAGPQGALFYWVITSSGGPGTINGSRSVAAGGKGTVTTDVTSLPDGTLTVTVTGSNAGGNGPNVTDDVTKNTTAQAPTNYVVSWEVTDVDFFNQAAAPFTISAVATVDDADYDWVITTSGGAGQVSGQTSILAGGSEEIQADVSSLADGTLTVTVTGSNVGGTGPDVTDTVPKDATPPAPADYTVAWNAASIGTGNETAAPFTINATATVVPATYTWSITSDGGAGEVTDSAALSAGQSQQFTDDVSSLPDGTLTISVTGTNAGGTGLATTAQITKDTVVVPDPPANYTVGWDVADINLGNYTSVPFTINATATVVNADYDYTVSSSAGGTPVNGQVAINAGGTQQVNVNTTNLNDGNITVAVTGSNAGGSGNQVTDVIAKDLTPPAPADYTVTWDVAEIDENNETNVPFTISAAATVVNADYSYSITSSGGGTAVNGNQVINAGQQAQIFVNLNGLGDGTVTIAVTGDNGGSTGPEVTDQVNKDTTATPGDPDTIAGLAYWWDMGYPASMTFDTTNTTNVVSMVPRVYNVTPTGANNGTMTERTDVGTAGNCGFLFVTGDTVQTGGYCLMDNTRGDVGMRVIHNGDAVCSPLVGSFTVFVAFDPMTITVANNSGGKIFQSVNSTATFDGWEMNDSQNSKSRAQVDTWGDLAGFGVTYADPAIIYTTGTLNTMAWTYNDTTKENFHYVDGGNQWGPKVNGVNEKNINGWNRLSFGRRHNNSTTQPFEGKYFQVMVYDRDLSLAEIQSLQAYCDWRYTGP